MLASCMELGHWRGPAVLLAPAYHRVVEMMGGPLGDGLPDDNHKASQSRFCRHVCVQPRREGTSDSPWLAAWGLLCRQAKPSGAGVVMVQSRDDETVDYRDTRKLAQAMGARLIELQDAGRGVMPACVRRGEGLFICVIRWRHMTWRGAVLWCMHAWGWVRQGTAWTRWWPSPGGGWRHWWWRHTSCMPRRGRMETRDNHRQGNRRHRSRARASHRPVRKHEES